MSEKEQNNSGSKRHLSGVVIRKSGTNTVSVEVMRQYRHPKYEKAATATKRYLAHDPSDKIQAGEEVVIRECRPMSRKKRWIVVSYNDTQAS